jgi:hypothetical protein
MIAEPTAETHEPQPEQTSSGVSAAAKSRSGIAHLLLARLGADHRESVLERTPLLLEWAIFRGIDWQEVSPLQWERAFFAIKRLPLCLRLTDLRQVWEAAGESFDHPLGEWLDPLGLRGAYCLCPDLPSEALGQLALYAVRRAVENDDAKAAAKALQRNWPANPPQQAAAFLRSLLPTASAVVAKLLMEKILLIDMTRAGSLGFEINREYFSLLCLLRIHPELTAGFRDSEEYQDELLQYPSRLPEATRAAWKEAQRPWKTGQLESLRAFWTERAAACAPDDSDHSDLPPPPRGGRWREVAQWLSGNWRPAAASTAS